MLIPLEGINESELSCYKSIPELDELCTELWQMYFNPRTEPMDYKARVYLRERYNMAAERRNKLSGIKALVMITPSMRIQAYPGQPLMPIGIHRAVEALVQETKVVTIGTGNKIQQILALHKDGKTNKEIVAMGFNQSTVNRQVGEYKKKNH